MYVDELADIRCGLEKLRSDLEGLRARRQDDLYAQRLETAERIANEMGGMHPVERRYFDSGGKQRWAVLLRVGEWLRSWI